MKAYLGICIAIFVVSIALCYGVAEVLFHKGVHCLDLYQAGVRTPVFSGFLTMGSFLLALKSNILGRLKEAYDSEEYARDYATSQEDEPSTYYAPLERLARALGWTVNLCFVTSTFQMLFGFLPFRWAFALCAGLALFTMTQVVWLSATLMSQHQAWFKTIEAKRKRELEELDKKRKAERETANKRAGAGEA